MIRRSFITRTLTNYSHQLMVLFFLFCLATTVHALSWQDLWLTKDQQAQTMMNKGQFAKAKDTFERDDWRAASAYRAGDYAQAGRLYPTLKNEDAYFNQGNALAHLGQYKQAIAAYDKTLGLNPNHQDAIHNRKILDALLKKDKQKDQDKQNQDKQDQDKQDQDKQDQDKQDQDKQDQDKQDQDKQDQNKQDQDKQDQDKQDQGKQDQNKQDKDKQDQDKQDQDKQDQDKQDQDKQDKDKQDQDKQDQDKQDQDKQDQGKQDQDKQDQDKQDQDKSATDEAKTQALREKQQAKEQWLRLIPDDPGGLMREKFLRDHLRRQRGWNQ
jgi:Ca-activated chloride channel family protein